jgi:hypothetical protein
MTNASTQPISPLEQHADLTRKRDAAYQRYSEHMQGKQNAERRMGALAKQITADELRSDKQAEKDYDAAAADFAHHRERAGTALDKVKTLDAEIEACYGAHFAVFAEEASRVTEVADTALADLCTAYRHARKCWQDATEAWAGPTRAHRTEGVPPFPISEHVMTPIMRMEARAQPPSVEVLEPLGDDPELDEVLGDD